MKLAYAGEAQMQIVDGLKRMGDVMNRQSLKETTNGQIPKDSSVSLRDVTFAVLKYIRNLIHKFTACDISHINAADLYASFFDIPESCDHGC